MATAPAGDAARRELQKIGVELRAYIEREKDNPEHLAWVKDVERQISARQFDKEPLDAAGIEALFARMRQTA